MWDPIGHYIYVTRDIVWLKRTCFAQNNAIEYSVVPVIEDEESVEPNDETVTNNNNNEEANSNEEVNQEKEKLKVTFGGEELVPTDYEEANSAGDKSNKEPFLHVTTRSGCAVQTRKFYQHEYQGMLANSTSSKKMFSMICSDDEDGEEEDKHYESEVIEEMSCVGAGIRGGYSHSSISKALNYKQEMKSN